MKKNILILLFALAVSSAVGQNLYFEKDLGASSLSAAIGLGCETIFEGGSCSYEKCTVMSKLTSNPSFTAGVNYETLPTYWRDVTFTPPAVGSSTQIQLYVHNDGTFDAGDGSCYSGSAMLGPDPRNLIVEDFRALQNALKICTTNTSYTLSNNITGYSTGSLMAGLQWTISPACSGCTSGAATNFKFDASKATVGTTYTVTAKLQYANGIATAPFTIVVEPIPTLSSSIPSAMCSDVADINLTSSFSANYSGSFTFSCVAGTCGSGMFYTSAGSAYFNPDYIGTSTAYTATIRGTYLSDAGCTATIDKVIQVGIPFTLDAGSDFSVCKNASSVALTGTNSASGPTITWSGTGVSGTNFVPSNASVIAGNSYVLTYTVDNGTGCVKTDTRTVTVNSVPATPVVTAPIICSGNTALIDPTDVSGVTFDYYNVLTAGSALSSGNSYTTAALSASTTYYVAARNTTTSCTSSPRTAVAITVNTTPGTPTITASPGTTACGPTNFTLTAAGASGSEEYRWFNASNVVQGTGVNFATGTLAVGGPYTYKATRRNTATGCESAYQTTSLTVNNLPTINAPANGASFDFCTGTGSINLLTLTAANPTGGTFSSTNVNISSRLSGTSNATLSLTGITAGVYPLRYTYTSGCSAFVDVSLNVSNGVGNPSAADKVNCSPGQTATLSVGSIDASSTYYWFDVASGGSSLGTGTSFNTPALSTTKSYYVEGRKGSCISVRDEAKVTVVDFGVVDAGVDLGACSKDVTFNLADGTNTPSGGTFTGTGVSGNFFSGSSLTTGQTYTITYTVSQSGCTATDTRKISLGLQPVLTANPGQSVNPGELVKISHNYSNAQETVWTFGDGWSVSQLVGAHYYYVPGPKDITVYIKVNQSGLICDGTFTFEDFITVLQSDIVTGNDDPIAAAKNVEIYPNPVTDRVIIKSQKAVQNV